MRKISIIFAMAAVVLTSCVKEETPGNSNNQSAAEPSGELVEKVFTAQNLTKTYLDGVTLNWCAGDEISVWDGVANRKFTMEGEPNGASATFKGYVDADATEFYAIYPYSEELAYSTESGAHIFSVSKPSLQYANPEGGLADGAAYACGKADADGNIAFINRSALLKFSIAEGMEVKSVTLTGNAEDDYIAGTLNFKYDATHEFTVGYANDDNRATSVTLCNEDGSNLKTGVNYYMSLTGNEFDQGYTIALELAGGKTISRPSSKAILYMSDNIYPLASAPISKSMFTYKAIYDAGEDIMIAGKAYNKSVYGEAELISATDPKDFTASGDKVYFIDYGAECKLSMSAYSDNKIILVGNDPTCRTQVVQDKPFMLTNENCHIAVMNLDIDMQITTTGSGNDVLCINENPVVDRIAFDNCRLEYPTNGRQFMYESKTTSTYNEFAMHNCDFVITVENQHAYILKVDSSTMTHGTFDFQNNVFWHTSSLESSYGFNILSGTSTLIKEIIFKNNTFVNVKTQSNASYYFQISSASSVSSVDIQNNLIYNEKIANSGGEFLIRASATAGTCVNNIAYTAGHSKGFNAFGSTPSWATKFTQLSKSPLTTCEVATGTFVKAAAYESYGAQR